MCPRLDWWSARAPVYQALYFDSTTMFTVCVHGLGTTLNISSSLCKHSQLWANLYQHSTFEWIAFFSRNRSNKKDELSHQSLNITSSSNAIVKILCHTITLCHAGSYKYKIAPTFVKPRGGEGQNGWLKWSLGFLVWCSFSLCSPR